MYEEGAGSDNVGNEKRQGLKIKAVRTPHEEAPLQLGQVTGNFTEQLFLKVGQ